MKVSVGSVKTVKGGATHSDGTPMMCITCRIEKKLEDGRKRARQATVVVVRVSGSGTRREVGYCEIHIPKDIT